MQGRFIHTRARGGLGELPSTPLAENGALNLSPPLNSPPRGNNSAPSSAPNQSVQLAANQSVWQRIVFLGQPSPVKIQDYLARKFLIIVNNSTNGTLYIGFGYQPGKFDSLVLPAGVGYEPYSYPANEIWVASDVANVEGLIIYGV
jgi:hypothetical protein